MFLLVNRELLEIEMCSYKYNIARSVCVLINTRRVSMVSAVYKFEV